MVPDDVLERHPAFTDPKPCILVLTNRALYLFPRPITVQGERFLVLSEYERYAFDDLLLLSLPYQVGYNPTTGDDFARRVDDMMVHLKSFHVRRSVWWRAAEAGARSRIVDTLNDVYFAKMGVNLEIENIDQDELVSLIVRYPDVLLKKLVDQRLRWWAMTEPLKEGPFLYSALEHGGMNGSLEGMPVPEPPSRDTVLSEWYDSIDDVKLKLPHPQYFSKRWLVLYPDNNLLHFSSKAEYDAFRLVGASGKKDLKFPEHFRLYWIQLSSYVLCCVLLFLHLLLLSHCCTISSPSFSHSFLVSPPSSLARSANKPHADLKPPSL